MDEIFRLINCSMLDFNLVQLANESAPEASPKSAASNGDLMVNPLVKVDESQFPVSDTVDIFHISPHVDSLLKNMMTSCLRYLILEISNNI